MDISAVIAGDRTATARFDSFPRQLRALLLQKIGALIAELEARVIEGAPNKTGKLRASISTAVREYEQRIVGKVLTNLVYAPVIEFGIHKQLSVRAHNQILSHAWAQDISLEEVSVDPYERLADVEGTLFMREALSGMRSEIVAELGAVIDLAAQEASSE